MHATSCAPERNWSHWGNIYNKKRTSMKLSTAERLVFVGSAAKIAYQDLKGAEEKESELLCHDVNEACFGTALVDTVLL
ncbi:hypothetical protein WJX77_003034 [Trebouxia sp. C0004]